MSRQGIAQSQYGSKLYLSQEKHSTRDTSAYQTLDYQNRNQYSVQKLYNNPSSAIVNDILIECNSNSENSIPQTHIDQAHESERFPQILNTNQLSSKSSKMIYSGALHRQQAMGVNSIDSAYLYLQNKVNEHKKMSNQSRYKQEGNKILRHFSR